MLMKLKDWPIICTQLYSIRLHVNKLQQLRVIIFGNFISKISFNFASRFKKERVPAEYIS